MNQEMSPMPAPEQHEALPSKGRYPISVVRVMAGVEPEHLASRHLPQENLDRYKENLRSLDIFKITDSHVQESSRSERTPVPEDSIEEANRKWALQTAEWFQALPDTEADTINRIFVIERGIKNESGEWTVSLKDLADNLYKRRGEFFDGENNENPGGDLDVGRLVYYLSYDMGDNPRDVASLERDLTVIEPFLYIFGKEKTVAQIKHRVLAEAAMEEIKQTPEDQREAVFLEIDKVLEQEISDEEAKTYLPGVSETVGAVSVDGILTPVAEAAPVNEDAEASLTALSQQSSQALEPSEGDKVHVDSLSEGDVEPAPFAGGGAWEGSDTQRRRGLGGEESQAVSERFKTPDEWRDWLKNPKADIEVFDSIYALREEVEEGFETAEGWKKIKAEAKQELENLPEDVIEKLYERFSPFIERLPSGHGEGHFARDLVNFTTLMSDPKAKELYRDEVEVVVGSFAGLFHDIGNSVVKRYDDAVRSAGHAEVGAYLFGQVAQDIIPQNLLKLVEYSIAAHTHYGVKDYPIDKNGRQKRSYADRDAIVEDESGRNRLAIWLTRQTDRQDMFRAAPYIIRHSETKAVPTQDFTDGYFHETDPNEIRDFQFQFRPEALKRITIKPDGSTAEAVDVLAHILSISQSAFAKNIYTQYDSEWFTNLAKDGEEGIKTYIREVSNPDGATLDESAVDAKFDQFYAMSRIIDPGRDIQDVISLFKSKFATMSPEDRSRWSHGFDLLVGQLWPEWFEKTTTIMQSELPSLGSPKVDALVKDIQHRAQQVMTAFNPDLLTVPEDQLPKISDLMKIPNGGDAGSDGPTGLGLTNASEVAGDGFFNTGAVNQPVEANGTETQETDSAVQSSVPVTTQQPIDPSANSADITNTTGQPAPIELQPENTSQSPQTEANSVEAKDEHSQPLPIEQEVVDRAEISNQLRADMGNIVRDYVGDSSWASAFTSASRERMINELEAKGYTRDDIEAMFEDTYPTLVRQGEDLLDVTGA